MTPSVSPIRIFKQPKTSRDANRARGVPKHPPRKRAWGMPGARRTRGRACSVESTRVSHHGRTGITRHSRTRMVLTVSFALSGDRACLPPSPAKTCFRTLDASVGASGPHDFAVRFAPLVCSAKASTASRTQRTVTIAIRPSCGTGCAKDACDLGEARREIFFWEGLDYPNQIDPLKEIRFLAQWSCHQKTPSPLVRLIPIEFVIGR